MRCAVAVLLCAAVGDALTSCGKNDECSCTDGDCRFVCDDKDECKDSEILCSGASCHIECTGDKGCEGGHMECSADRCNINCNKNSCKKLESINTNGRCRAWGLTQRGMDSNTPISWCDSTCYNGAGQLSAACDTNSGVHQHCICKHDAAGAAVGLYCAPGSEQCKTICNGDNSCSESEHLCASDKCELFCNGKHACKKSEYKCTSDDCTISCNDHESCQDLKLTCPDGSGKRCHLKCLGEKACKSVSSSHVSGNSLTVECNPGACHDDLLQFVVSNTPQPTARPTPEPTPQPTPEPTLEPTPVPTSQSGCRSFAPTTQGVTAAFCAATCFSNNAEAIMECNVNCECDDCVNWHPISPTGPVTELWCYLFCNSPASDHAVCTAYCECAGATPVPTDAPSTPVPTSVPVARQCSGSDDCEITCNGLEECRDLDLRCGTGECDVECSGMQSCYKSSIDCEDADDCSIVCSGYLSCRHLTEIPTPVVARKGTPLRDVVLRPANQITGVAKPAIHCGSGADDCDIDCTGMLACEEVAMKCESDECDLTCSQTQSCQEVKHECVDGPCNGKCTGYRGCQNAVFAWGSGGDAVLECSQTLSCAGADIECPKDRDCIVKCSGWESCKGMKLRCPESDTGKKCEIQCTHGRACADMYKTTHLTGHITAVCNGWEACEDDLINYTPDPPVTETCAYWVPTDVGAWTGFTHTLCDSMCKTTGTMKDICTAANNVVQLCECGTPQSVNNPKPADATCLEWGPSNMVDLFAWATLPSIPADWCDIQCTNPMTSAVCEAALSICECKRERPVATPCDTDCTCTETDCFMRCDSYRECESVAKQCSSATTTCNMECSGLESCKDGAATCSGNTCSVTCSGYASCSGNGAALDCTSPRMCHSICSGVNSCKDVAAKCTSTNDCRLDCTASSSCEDMVHTCTGGAGKAGMVTCNAYKSCKDATFKWSDCGATVIKCTDEHSCEGARFECPEGHSCLIECEGEESCKDVNLKCPVSMPANTLCEIKCTGVRSCLNVNKDKVSGAVTANCTGHEACHSDLSGAVPTSCVEYEPTDANSTIDCNFLCTNPTTDSVCRDDTPTVAQLCRCKVQPTPKPSCGLWVPTAHGQSTGTSSASCTQWCANPLTDSVCSFDGTNMNNRVCNVWGLTARGQQQPGVTTSWCESNCYAPGTTVLHAACNPASGEHQHCTCADASVTPLCQCEVPTPAPTPAPNAPALKPILKKVFRSFMRRLKRWFKKDQFISALLSLLGKLVRGCKVHWVCPASACNPDCPTTRAEKIARGCTSGYLVLERGAAVLQDTDSSYVEYDFDYDEGSAGQVEEELTVAIEAAKTDSGNTLAEFGMEGVQQEETEVLTEEDDDDDSFPGWAIAVIVICVVFCCIIVIGIIWKVSSSSTTAVEDQKENKKSDPTTVDDTEDPSPVSNEPVDEPVAKENPKKADGTEKAPWK